MEETIKKLIYYVSISNKKNNDSNLSLPELSKKEIVINSLYYCTITPAGSNDVANCIKEKFGIIISINEITEILSTLTKEGSINKISNKYILSSDLKKNIDNNINENSIQENYVLDEWINEFIKPSYSNIIESDLNKLKQNLKEFLHVFFRNHAADAVDIIINKKRKYTELNIENIISSLKLSDNLKKIALEKFPDFLCMQKKNNIEYLLAIINKAFKFLSTVCDSDVLEVFKSRFNGKKVYLDTCVLYRFFGFNGDERKRVIEELILLLKEFSFDIRVTSKTIEEFKNRFKNDIKQIEKNIIPQNYTQLAFKYADKTDFRAACWKECAEDKINIHMFILKYLHIDIILKQLNINIDDINSNLDEKLQPKVIECISNLRKLESNDKTKAEKAMEHDAYIITYVDFFNNYSSSYLECNTWLLTTDKLLTKYQASSYTNQNTTQFIMKPSQLINILRFTTAFNKEINYDELFLSFFSKSLSSSNNINLSNDIIEEVLNRISYFNKNIKLAELVLTDSLFIERYEKCETDEEKNNILQKELTQKADEFEIKIDEKDKQVNVLKKNLENEQIKSQEEQQKNKLLEEQFKTVSKQLAAAKETNNQDNKKYMLSIYIFESIIIFGVAFLVCFINKTSNNWQNIHIFWRYFTLCFPFISLFILAYLQIKQYIKTIAGILSIIIAIVGFLQNFIK